MGGVRQAAFRRARAVSDYVGRYTHRVAISNNRLLEISEGKVTFRYRNWRTVESFWTCRRGNHRRWTALRIIVSAMKNSPAVRCGSAQSVTKVACWRLRSCREITAGRQRSRIAHDEEDSYEMQIKLLRASLAEPSGRSSVAKRVIPEKI
jgi:hypothetical protein